MSFDAQIASINAKILDGKLDEAGLELERVEPQTQVEKRIHGHFRAIILTRAGKPSEGLQVLTDTLEKHGENVNLLRDIMVCQYHLNNTAGFRTSLSLLEATLALNEMRLSHGSLLACELMVGKFLEEEGRLAQAIGYFERAYQRAVKADSPLHRARALVQKARWHGLYLPNTDLSHYYRELISLDAGAFSQDLKIELEHSLMLIELRMVGADHAWQRVQNLDPGIPEIEQRLMAFDFIEGCLSQDLPLPGMVKEKINQFKQLDCFEDFVKSLVEGSLEAGQKIQRLTALASLLPWASYLRLLCVSANREVSLQVRQEIGRKIRLIVESLDSESQALWKARLKEGLETNEIKVEYLSRHRKIMVQGRSIDLSKKKFGLQLLEGLSEQSSLSVDQAIGLLWETTFTPEHYHRLRMGIHRLNVLIHKSTGLGKIIEVDSQAVRLRPEVKLRRSEDPLDSQFLSI